MWFEAQLGFEPTRLVFLDETDASIKTARLSGQSCYDEMSGQ